MRPGSVDFNVKRDHVRIMGCNVIRNINLCFFSIFHIVHTKNLFYDNIRFHFLSNQYKKHIPRGTLNITVTVKLNINIGLLWLKQYFILLISVK
jgi:hypothetical protein